MRAAELLAHQKSTAPNALVADTKTMAIRTTLAILGTNLDFIYVPFYPPLDKNAEGHFPVAPMGKFR